MENLDLNALNVDMFIVGNVLVRVCSVMGNALDVVESANRFNLSSTYKYTFSLVAFWFHRPSEEWPTGILLSML